MFKKFVNEDHENKNWFSLNYFFAGTFALIFIMILVYGVTAPIHRGAPAEWYDDIFNFRIIAESFANSFCHNSWSHVLFNMACFLFCGLYLERKMGSIKFLLLILLLGLLCGVASTAAVLDANWAGFSVVNFALYFYIIIDFIFLALAKTKRNKLNLIFGGIMMVLIYIFMSINTEASSFYGYPLRLANNAGHFSGALIGIVMALTIRVARITTPAAKAAAPSTEGSD